METEMDRLLTQIQPRYGTFTQDLQIEVRDAGSILYRVWAYPMSRNPVPLTCGSTAVRVDQPSIRLPGPQIRISAHLTVSPQLTTTWSLHTLTTDEGLLPKATSHA